MRPLVRILAVVALITTVMRPMAGSAQGRPQGLPEDTVPVIVVSVTDGDTIRVQFAGGSVEPVRLILVDAPETVDPNKAPECFGQEASAYTQAHLTPGRMIWLERDISERDRYARLLRYVWYDDGYGHAVLFNEQLVRDGFAVMATFPPDVEYQDRILAAQQAAIRSGTGLWAACGSAQSGCDLVEVRPGYPGFRGNLPGMLGPGDVVCLSVLQTIDPYFVKTDQDQQNLAAAQHLGVSGHPEDWTWETWMQIAAVRKLPPLCYACVATNGGNALPSYPPGTDANDPRIQLGRFGERTVVSRFLDTRGLSRATLGQAPTDDQLRAIIGMANPGRYLTAPELLSAYDEFLSMWFCLSGPPCNYPDVDLLYNNLITQGGYAPISGDASEGDQYYVLAEGASALSPMLAFGGGAIVDSINSAFRDWHLAGPDRPAFGEWFRSAQHSD